MDKETIVIAKLTKSEIKEAISKTDTMLQAAALLKVQFATFKRHALKFGLYCPNQGSKGRNKPKREGNGKYHLQEILDGKFPAYSTFKLKLRLFEIGLKSNECEECGISEWQGKEIQCELDHIDGDRTNHRLSNLKILCPNCHSQTSTFRSKKRNVRLVKSVNTTGLNPVA